MIMIVESDRAGRADFDGSCIISDCADLWQDCMALWTSGRKLSQIQSSSSTYFFFFFKRGMNPLDG